MCVTAPHDAAHGQLQISPRSPRPHLLLHQVACRLAGPRRWTRGTTRPTSTTARLANAPGSALLRQQRRRCQPAGRRALTRGLGLHTITMPALGCGSGSAREVRTTLSCWVNWQMPRAAPLARRLTGLPPAQAQQPRRAAHPSSHQPPLRAPAPATTLRWATAAWATTETAAPQ